MVNSHDKPFVVIDKNYQILAINDAYAQEYGTTSDTAVGRKCYQVSHGKDHPCSDEGEDCPYEHVFKTGEAKVCTHIHCDSGHHMHQVKVSAFPLKGSNNELFLGECIEELSTVHNHITSSERMVGESAEFTACVTQLNNAAGSDAPVLLQGETGTGKELAAEFIHTHSSRNLKPFQIVDSTVLTENLFESEMFGHVEGAFTGSKGEKQGLFELAEGGTIFLDEIGEMPVAQQAKLLRVLQEREIQRVGGDETLKVDVRIVAATNRDLESDVAKGRFREDLFYRLNVMPLNVPPLRERREDIPLLAQHFLKKFTDKNRKAVKGFIPLAMDMLVNYDWPGNVRELENASERAVILLTGEHITENQLPLNITEKYPDLEPQSTAATPIMDGSHSLEDIEKEAILATLKASNGNKAEAARRLGVTRKTLHNKLKSYGLMAS